MKQTIYNKKYKGFVYFVQGESGGAVKIGFSKNPEIRIKELQTGYPDTLKILCLIPGNEQTEKRFHKQFDNYRLNGEWFEPVQDVFDEMKFKKNKQKN